MSLDAFPLILIVAGLTAYAVLGGADFGAGFWSLFGSRRAADEAIRDHAHHAMGPVWEANHVWLIFVLVVCWTGYPTAFGSIMSTLAVPLFIAAVGIILRGTAYALRVGTGTVGELRAVDLVFALSSIIVPFAFGAAIGGIASGRVPRRQRRGRHVLELAQLDVVPRRRARGRRRRVPRGGLPRCRRDPPGRARAGRGVPRARARDGCRGGRGRDGGADRRARRRERDLGRADERVGPRRGRACRRSRAARRCCSSGCAATARRARPQRRRLPRCSSAGCSRSGPDVLPGLSIHQAAAGRSTLVALVIATAIGAVLLDPVARDPLRPAARRPLRRRGPRRTARRAAGAAPRPGRACSRSPRCCSASARC